jgi:hypothetical protein
MVSPELKQVIDLELPQFVTFGPPRPTRTIRSENGAVVIDERPELSCETLAEAYDAVAAERPNYQFDDSLIADGHCSYKGDAIADPRGRVYVTNSEERDVFIMKLQYYNFLRFTNVYREDRQDWVNAFQWLQSHPFFWHVHEDLPFRWVVDHGLSEIRASVGYREDGTTYVTVHHGPFVGTPKARHTHDPSLDVTGMDFEDAFVKFAKIIDERYHLDGGPRRKLLPVG